jgi:hypothetical protein
MVGDYNDPWKSMPQSNVAITNASNVATIPANKHRRAVIFGNNLGATIFWLIGTTPTATTGIPLPTGSAQVELTRVKFGTGVGEAIMILGTAANQSVPYTEFLDDPCACSPHGKG